MRESYNFNKILERKKLFAGKAFDVAEYKVLVNGQKVKREIIERKHGVVTVPIDADLNIYMISEYCAGSNSFILSLPGGKVENGEEDNIIEAAQREMQEEIGLRAKKMFKLQFAYSHPSISNRKSHAFLAYDLFRDPLPESGEIIDIVKMPLEQAIESCYADFESDVSTIGNLYMAKNKLIKLGLM